jgi:HAD superfamily hydrolase (TIGR01484 family)
MKGDILICTDLDRTLLPNGLQAESPHARERFARLAARPEISLAYVTGRHRELVLTAIREYHIPVPRTVIGDVGTTIYTIEEGQWLPWDEWSREIAPDWNGLTGDDLHPLFEDMEELRLQEREKQNSYKLSYYAAPDAHCNTLLDEMRKRLRQHNVRASLIWSVDETVPVGLLDLLPANATKLHAIEFLMEKKGFLQQNTIFAGDSGNDIPVMVSSIQSVLVANASESVRSEAVQQATERGTLDSLYLAKGNFEGMNGNYSAGILEGLAHYIPETRRWITEGSHEPR